MTPHTFRIKATSAQQPLVGCWITIDSIETAALIARAKFDFVFIDMEHTGLSIAAVQALVPVFATQGIFSIVRVPEIAKPVICRLLDCGVQGIMVPNVTRADEIRDVLSWVHYPPKGSRGFGPWRASDYFLRTADYINDMADGPIVVFQIETSLAIENVGQIIGDYPIDYLCTGPNDLAASLGKLGQPGDSEVLARISQLVNFCREKGIRLASGTGVDMQTADCAYSLIPITSDVEILLRGAAQILAERCGTQTKTTQGY